MQWSQVKAFVSAMILKLKVCLIDTNQEINYYCKSLSNQEDNDPKMDPAEASDPICIYYRKYRAIILDHDGTSTTTNSLRLSINLQTTIQNIINEEQTTQILKKIEITGEKIMQGQNEMKKSMGNYFLALAVHDEIRAVEDMDWAKVLKPL